MLRRCMYLQLLFFLVEPKIRSSPDVDPFTYCLMRSNVSLEQAMKLPELDIRSMKDDYNMKCYLHCVLEEMAFLANCDFESNRMEHMGIQGPEFEIFEKCNIFAGEHYDYCECAYGIAKCIEEEFSKLREKNKIKA